MIKAILTAAAVSLAAATAAWALPVSQAPTLPPLNATDVIQIGHGHGHGGKHYNHKNYNKNYNYKHYNKHYNYKHGKYYYGGRYWGHRYYYAPYNWQGIGCIVVGPIWYCP